MSGLKIAPDLTLGLDAVTKTFAILAQRRKGKTYTASVIAEEMVAAGQPWVALDPTGAWWGLRAGAKGDPKGGLPVFVLGGQHGDVPLERTAGALIADLVVEEPRFYVLDLSAFESKAAERQFATDFAERFYRRKAKNPDAIHLFVDEADVFVPQRSPAGDQRMLGAFEAIVRRGGIRGIGTTLISQRAAVVNKNVLEQVDALIMLRTVGPKDRAALKDYIVAHGSEAEREALMGSLASLKLGEAWIWEPGSEPPLFERVQIRKRRTYNSSATPKAGERRGKVAMADVDLAALSSRIRETVEKAEADDPAKLRKRIRVLEAELKKRPTETKTVEVESVVEVPVVEASEVDKLRTIADSLATTANGILSNLAKASRKTSSPRRSSAATHRSGTAEGSQRERAAGGGRAEVTARPPAQPSENGVLSKQARVMLEALVARHPLRLTRTQLATFSGYSLRSSSWSKSMGELRGGGYVAEHRGEIEATELGFDVFGGTPPEPQSADEVRASWRASLKGPQATAFFDALVDAFPDALDRDELSEQTGYSKSSSSFSATTSLLRRNKLIDETSDGLRASETLFEEP